MKKLILFLAVMSAAVISAAALTGCGLPKEKPSAAKFTEAAKKAEYTVTEISETEVTASKNGYTVYFTVFETADNAKNAYADKHDKTMEGIKGESLSTNTTALNYRFHKFTSGDKFYVFYQAWDTLLTVEAGKDYKKEINAFLKDIGY